MSLFGPILYPMVSVRISLLTAAACVYFAGTLGASSLFIDGIGDRAKREHSKEVDNGSLTCLRIEIDAKDNVRLVDESHVKAPRRESDQVIGQRLYYEVRDNEGQILARGVRQDPRLGLRGIAKDRGNLLLTVPNNGSPATVSIYKVSYEAAGETDYQRDYRLLGQFDIGH